MPVAVRRNLITTPVTAVIAFGSNLGESTDTIRLAAERLSRHPGIASLRLSPLYRTAPVGYTDQPDFVNAAALIETTLDAYALLSLLHTVEQDAGRERSFRNAPRTLDLDIIDYGGQTKDDPALTLPNPRAHLRAFVMRPLADIAPDYLLPGHGSARDLAEALGTDGIAPLTEAV